MIVLDASAAIDLILVRRNAAAIAGDIARDPTMVMPAHFEADAYAGIRRLVNTKVLERKDALRSMSRVAELPGERVALAPLVPVALQLYDNVGAHDAFYVVLARERGASLLTSDGPLARASEQMGVRVILRPVETIG